MAKKIITKKDFTEKLVKKGINVSVEYRKEDSFMCNVVHSVDGGELTVTYRFATDRYKREYTRCVNECYKVKYDEYVEVVENLYISLLEDFTEYITNSGASEASMKENPFGGERQDDAEVEALPQIGNERDALNNITSEIVKSLGVAGVAQLNVALLIRTVYERKLYELGDYSNVYDYCADKFGIARGTASNWLMVATNFGEYDNSAQRYYLDKRLEGYSITQLILLRGMTVAEIIANTVPSMTCKQIKEIAKLFDKHVTENGKIVAPDIDDVETGDDYEDEDIYNDVDKIVKSTSAKARKPKFTCSVKGGVCFENSSQVAIIAKMIRDAVASKTFSIEIYVD